MCYVVAMEVVGVVTGIFSCIVAKNCLYSSLSRNYCNYVKNPSKEVEKLESKLKELSIRENDVKRELERARIQHGKEPKSEVQIWLENVNNTKTEVDSIINEIEAQKIYLSGCFLNICSRLKLGKRTAKKINEVTGLLEKSRFSDGLLATQLPKSGKTIPTTTLVGRTTAERTKEMIWEWLMNDEVRSIGVYGMGGVGKTTIMTHVNNRLLQETDQNVIWVTVSRELNIEKLQNNIAREVNLNLSNDEDELNRAAMLWQALNRRRRLVLILDDMWEAFPLEKVEIPRPTRENGWKLILTTRSREICQAMETNRNVKVEVLSEEETWELFRDKVGLDVLLSPDVQSVAKEAANQCGGLPLALITVGQALRQEYDFRVWLNALAELKGATLGIKGMDEIVFESLRFSYKRLRNDQSRACLLYCSLYPEDHRIDTEELIEYWMAEGLFNDLGSREAGINKGQTVLNELKSACMLQSVACPYGGVEHIKMHDLIRDMAINITRVTPRFLIRAGVGLKKSPLPDEWPEQVERVSLMDNDIEVLSGKPKCPMLSTLLLQNNPLSQNIPHSFFEHMLGLRVLDLSRTDVKSLPESLSNLENLRALILHDCVELMTLPSVAKLKALMLLDLSHGSITELPQGMEKLVNLKHIELSFTYNLRTFPRGVIPKLPHLEELSMYGSPWEWPLNTEAGGAGIEDHLSCTRLTVLYISFSDLQGLNCYVRSGHWQRLKRFKLFVGKTDINVASYL